MTTKEAIEQLNSLLECYKRNIPIRVNSEDIKAIKYLIKQVERKESD